MWQKKTHRKECLSYRYCSEFSVLVQVRITAIVYKVLKFMTQRYIELRCLTKFVVVGNEFWNPTVFTVDSAS